MNACHILSLTFLPFLATACRTKSALSLERKKDMTSHEGTNPRRKPDTARISPPPENSAR